MNSKEAKGDGPIASVWTIGYEGIDAEGFISRLRGAGVSRLVDVRRVAWSHKRGFKKDQLQEEMGKAGIEYVHMPQLGTPKDVQAKYKAGGSREEFLVAYLQHLEGEAWAVSGLAEMARERPTALMCFEADPANCHRSALADELGKHGLRRVDL
jgi:uncharacterized protein (DUF488 family)